MMDAERVKMIMYRVVKHTRAVEAPVAAGLALASRVASKAAIVASCWAWTSAAAAALAASSAGSASSEPARRAEAPPSAATDSLSPVAAAESVFPSALTEASVDASRPDSSPGAGRASVPGGFSLRAASDVGSTAGGGRRVIIIVVSSSTGFSGTFSGCGPRISDSKTRKKCLATKKCIFFSRVSHKFGLNIKDQGMALNIYSKIYFSFVKFFIVFHEIIFPKSFLFYS